MLPKTKKTPPVAIEPASHDWLLKALLLFFITIAVYIPAMDAGYIYDDDQLLTQNPAILRGVGFLDPESWRGLASIWWPQDARVSADYFPLTSTTLWIEWRLWGNNEPGTPPQFVGIGSPGYHVTNILLHACCALALWRVLLLLPMPGAWIASLLWAIHPVGVESVAWISERKNTLSMLLFLVTLLAWFRYQRTKTPAHYRTTLFWFVAALLAKTAIVMLPFVLLLYVWWLRGSLTKRDLKESIPFFILSFILGCVTVYFQWERAIGEEYIPISGPFGRFAGACFALGFYFYKIFAPFNLSLIYPQWHETLPYYQQMISAPFFVAFFLWAWRNRQTWGRHALLGMGFFVINLAPILGFMKMAYMRLTLVADHFQYTPMIGVIALSTAAITHWTTLKPQFRNVVSVLGVLVVVGLGFLTWQQAAVYRTKESIWTDTLKKNPNTWQANNHMGALLYARGNIDGAMYHFRRGVELKPYNCEVHNNLGLALMQKGRVEEALYHYKRAVEIKGDEPSIRSNYANALSINKQFQEAAAQFEKVLQISPNNPQLYFNYGNTLYMTGNINAAIAAYEKALQINPGFREALNNLEAAKKAKSGPAPTTRP